MLSLFSLPPQRTSRKISSLLAICAATLGAITSSLALASGIDKTLVHSDQVQAQLLAHAPQGVRAGEPLWLGLQLTHQAQWHTYWKNSGDSGQATELHWTLPAGVFAGEIAWPLPSKIPVGNLANYGYEGEVLLAVPLTISPLFQPDALTNSLRIQLHATWLVCRKECIPQEGNFSLDLPVRSATALHGALFAANAQAQPRALLKKSHMQAVGKELQITVADLPASAQGKTLSLFPETAGIIDNTAPMTQNWDGATWTAKIPLSTDRSASPDAMAFVLTPSENSPSRNTSSLPAKLPNGNINHAASTRQAWTTVASFTGAWPSPVHPPVAVSPALATALSENARTANSSSVTSPLSPPWSLAAWALALLGAFVGGLILNLMPCVFPILAIKVLGFSQSMQDTHAQRKGALAYTAGVVSSFVVLGGALLLLRAGGEALGWGFQLQTPAVVAALALLFTLLGLNLLGAFDFGSFLPSTLQNMQSSSPVRNSFLSGALAVAIASPCTAPFMGASLGLAMAWPPVLGISVFAAMGWGMALPYLVLGFVPRFLRWLPRPGAWMDVFRRSMAFPMFATAVWMAWILGKQTGLDGATALLGALVAVSALVWATGLAGASRWVAFTIALTTLVGWLWMTGSFMLSPMPVSRPSSAQDDKALWQTWQPPRVAQALGRGQAVFVDFTAAWCVTCQVNKRTTLANPAVLAAFSAQNILLLQADWTRHDANISNALAQLGRSGVPVYVLYRPNAAPLVLSELISPQDIFTALKHE